MNLPLKIAIVRSGQPQWAIARTIGVHPVRLSQIVRGHARPRTAEAARLAAALHVEVRDLFPDAAPEAAVEVSA